ncbi:MAG: hypothetical protein ACI37O_07590, partial [Candidatus Avelusimicrobium sp.]|uniref:hypothetical protein n=1 Tax=Candidatus Avelusimicrobium sp. TaxID=3048833 RepID=UPI003F096CF6
PTVGSFLDLGSVTKLPEGFNPTVGGDLDLGSVTELPEGFNPTVGGSLDLGSVTELPEGFNPTVGGSLDLGSVTELPEGFNPTVGGSLDLRSVTELPEGFTPTVGGYLYGKNGNRYIGAHVVLPNIPEPELEWHGGKYVSIDGIFCEVINKNQQGKQIIRKCRKVNSDKKFFIVSIDGVHAHGDTIKEARDSFVYKISKRDTSEYKGLTLKSKVSFADAIKIYRVITGACEAGTRMFVESLPKADVKKTYTVAEMIALTKGQYGAETFARFFKEEK